jgi:translation initiation factor IF-2
MVEEKEKSYRLNKVMKEFNVGSDTIVNFLKGKGYTVSDNIATSKLSQEMYDLLAKEFVGEKKQKERAEQIKHNIKEVKQAIKGEGKPAEEEREALGPIISAAELKSNLTKPTAAEIKAAEPHYEGAAEKKAEKPAEKPAVVEAKVETPETTEPAKAKLKVVGQIDLEAGKKKAAPKAEAKTDVAPEAKAKPEKPAPVQTDLFGTQEPVVAKGKKKTKAAEEEAAPAPQPVEPPQVVAQAPDAAVVEDEESVIRAKDNTPKLGGLKIMGKINLEESKAPAPPKGREGVRRPAPPQEPSGANANQGPPTEDAARAKRKRKTATPIQPNAFGNDRKGGGSKAPPRRPEPTTREVSDNIRATLAGMSQGRGRSRQKMRRDKRDVRAAQREQLEQDRLAESNVLEVTEFVTANELASLMDVSVNDVIAKCMELGMFVSINQRINAELIQLIAEEFGYEVKFLSLEESFESEEDTDAPEDLKPRAPIVTVMGHVDHGKTSLLDYIRKTNVIAGEAGGITQHIGAYEVTLDNGRKITFLDTPGHEAFTAMRARGAQVTDIAIIVIAADDQVMPQTREAINHAQAAGVPMVFAINKIDKPGALPEKIKEQLSQMNLLVEDWGGKFQSQHISAKQGVGITELLDKVLLEADLLDLKANPDRLARGTVIEAQLDKGRGVVTTLLVQNGTMHVGDIIVANNHYGKIKAMSDERGKRITEAGPSTPVQVLGLDGVPQAGDKFQGMEEEREARDLVAKRSQLMREQTIRTQKHVTLEDIARRRAVGDFKQLNVIVKGDVDGSVEALADSLLKLSTDEVAVNIILKAVGQITESDVLLASASDAIIVCFQVRPSAAARKVAAQEGVQLKMYSVIYDAINEVKDALEGMLAPTLQEEMLGVAEVREVFRVTKVGTVAGCMVTEGKINRANQVRLVRDGIVVYTGKVLALKRFKDDVREVAEGYECGISIEGYNDIKVGDTIEAFSTIEVKRTLA